MKVLIFDTAVVTVYVCECVWGGGVRIGVERLPIHKNIVTLVIFIICAVHSSPFGILIEKTEKIVSVAIFPLFNGL